MIPIAQQILGLLTPRARDWAVPTVMPPVKPSAHDRESPRHPVPPARQSCELRSGSTVVPVSLENESNTGFAVLANHLCGLKAGKMVELRTEEGWLPVQIVYVQEVARPHDVDGTCEFRFRLGLKR